jgi:hypothetical protein
MSSPPGKFADAVATSVARVRQTWPGGKPKPGRYTKPTHATQVLLAKQAVETAQQRVTELQKKREVDLGGVSAELAEGLQFMDKAFTVLAEDNVDANHRCDAARDVLSMALNRIRHGLVKLIDHGLIDPIDDLRVECVVHDEVL